MRDDTLISIITNAEYKWVFITPATTKPAETLAPRLSHICKFLARHRGKIRKTELRITLSETLTIEQPRCDPAVHSRVLP